MSTGRLIYEFDVLGEAKTAGSKRAFALRRKDGSLVMRDNGTPVVSVTDDCAKGKQWRRIVVNAARNVIPANAELLTGPLCLELYFEIARPKNHYRTGKFADQLRADSPGWHAKKPDVLKLARAVEDALTGVIWVDDSQIAHEVLTKRWGSSDVLHVAVRQLDESQPVLFVEGNVNG